jgi:hypothetical protein
MADLFQDGHRRGHRYPLRPVRRPDFNGAALKIANIIYALERLGEPSTVMLGFRCPYCGDPGAWLRASAGRIELDCTQGCEPEAIVRALLGRLNEEAA